MRRLSALTGLLVLACAPASAPRAGAGITTKVSDSIIAVGIAHKAASVLLRPIGNFSVIDQTTGEIQKLTKGVQYLVEADEDQRIILGKHLFFGPTRLLPGSPGEHVLIEDKKYRGNILFRPNKDSTLTVIDEIGIEEYLQGVLPKEMNPDWPEEALKAQAVVARTFALNNIGKFSQSGYDLSNDSFSQMYSGLEDVSPRVQKAVRETAGQVLYWEGSRVEAYFHSTCGGHTIDPASAWGTRYSSRKLPRPLRGVRDRYCRATPNFEWDAYFATGDILKALNSHGVAGARLNRIRVAEKDGSGRATLLKFKLDGYWKSVKAQSFRMWMGPSQFKSTFLRRITRKQKGFAFLGRGYGHGVGLCQWGARIQAAEGRDYKQILNYYFPHADLVRTEL